MNISQDDINRIRDATDVQALVEQSGIRLRSQFGRKIGWCPFCDHPRTPAFAVYPDHYHCHRCSAHGGCFDWLIKTQGMVFREAAEYLASMAGISLTTDRVSRSAVAATREDIAGSQWWWTKRREAAQRALDEIMANGPPDITPGGELTDDWTDCVVRLLGYIDSRTIAERLCIFRAEVSGAEWKAYRAWLPEQKAAEEAYAQMREWLSERLAHMRKHAEENGYKDCDEFIRKFGAEAYRRAIDSATWIPPLTGAA